MSNDVSGVNAARGIFGPLFVPRKDFVPGRGRWHCYEFMVQANTPGQRDGRVAFWIDGHLAADFPNLRFRSVDALKINRVNVGMKAGITVSTAYGLTMSSWLRPISGR